MTGSSVKYFMGFLLTGEIKMHLNQSAEWKEATLFQKQLLQTATFKDKEYLGLSFDSPISRCDSKKKEKELRNHFAMYCPACSPVDKTVYLFPQLFIS